MGLFCWFLDDSHSLNSNSGRFLQNGLSADTRLYTLLSQSVGPSVTFFNSKRFLHYYQVHLSRKFIFWIDIKRVRDFSFSVPHRMSRLGFDHFHLAKWHSSESTHEFSQDMSPQILAHFFFSSYETIGSSSSRQLILGKTLSSGVKLRHNGTLICWLMKKTKVMY